MMIWLFYLDNIPQKNSGVYALGTVNEYVSGIPYQLFINPFLITDSEWPVIFSNKDMKLPLQNL